MKDKDEKPEKNIIVSGYFHIGNSGATISVCDNGHGPQLEIQSSAFGNLNNKFQLLLTKDSLAALATMLDKASRCTFSRDYVNAARLNRVDYDEEAATFIKSELFGDKNDKGER